MNSNTNQPNIEKLPKWAQEHINQLRRERDGAQAQLKDYLDTQSPGLVYVREGIGEKRYLQTDRVTFALPHGEVTAQLENDHLYLSGQYGSASFVVQPWSSNVCRIFILEGNIK